MKTKLAVIALTVGILTGSAPALASEAPFDPGSQWYDVNGDGALRLWGVPEAGGNALVANPDYGWPAPVAIAAWYAVLLKAQQMGMTVVIGYDPVSYDIWYIGKPR